MRDCNLIHPVFHIYLKTPKSIPFSLERIHVYLIFLPPFTAIKMSSYSLSTNWQWKPLCLAWIIFCFCLVANCWVQDWEFQTLQRKSESAASLNSLSSDTFANGMCFPLLHSSVVVQLSVSRLTIPLSKMSSQPKKWWNGEDWLLFHGCSQPCLCTIFWLFWSVMILNDLAWPVIFCYCFQCYVLGNSAAEGPILTKSSCY